MVFCITKEKKELKVIIRPSKVIKALTILYSMKVNEIIIHWTIQNVNKQLIKWLKTLSTAL